MYWVRLILFRSISRNVIGTFAYTHTQASYNISFILGTQSNYDIFALHLCSSAEILIEQVSCYISTERHHFLAIDSPLSTMARALHSGAACAVHCTVGIGYRVSLCALHLVSNLFVCITFGIEPLCAHYIWYRVSCAHYIWYRVSCAHYIWYRVSV